MVQVKEVNINSYELNNTTSTVVKNKGGRPKGRKNDKDLTDSELEVINKDYEEKYQEFLSYYKEDILPVRDILKKMGTHHKSKLYSYIKERLSEDEYDPQKRKGKIIGVKLKQKAEFKYDENLDAYENYYQQYKKYFIESDLTIKEIYNKLGLSSRSVCSDYIRNRCKEEGLNGHERRAKLYPVKEVTDEELAHREELYAVYKKLFLETDKTIGSIFKKLNITESSGAGRYIKKRAKEDGLDGNERMYRIQRERVENAQGLVETYQQYKYYFKNTTLPVNKILKELDVPINSPQHRYIREQAKKDGLNGNIRRANIAKLHVKPKPVKKRKMKQPNYFEPRDSKYSDNTIKCLKNSEELLKRIFVERNIKLSTQKGYIVSVCHWFEYLGEKYSCLQDIIDYYIGEEDKRIPMRERTLKKELLGFREYLLNYPNIESDKSLSSYFSKVGSVLRHFGLEMPSLPPVKMEKGYVSNFKDLPTREMIKIACEQSNLSLQSLILFMSSSGTAKAETLSITISMFLKGCEDYLDEEPTNENMHGVIDALQGRHDIVPLIYLRRLKTDKWYYTCCSPEASYIIFEYLKSREELSWDDKLFPFKSSLVLTRFQQINDNNNWGRVGKYRRFRGHALRKFMASNIGLPRDQVDSFQGRSKDMIQEAYFKQDPNALKEIYTNAMHRVMIFDNWGYSTNEEKSNNTPTANPLIQKTNTPKDNSVIQMESQSKNNMVSSSISISEELLNYAKLLDMGLITKTEFNNIKTKLLGGLLG